MPASCGGETTPVVPPPSIAAASLGSTASGTAQDPKACPTSLKTIRYAADLDLFGRGSLFQLISTARLGGGERMLAGWLLTAASTEEVRRRQASVDELRPQIDLRERLALAGDEIAGYLDTSQLAAWGQAAPLLPVGWPRVLAALLGAANAVALAAAFLLDAGTGWFAVSAIASAGFALWWRRAVSQVLQSANAPVHQLNLLAEVLEVVEEDEGGAQELEAIRRRLIGQATAASVRIHELRRLMDLLLHGAISSSRQLRHCCSGGRNSPGPSRDGDDATARSSAIGLTPSASSRRSARSRAMPSNTPTTRFPSSSRATRYSTARPSAIRFSSAPCQTTYAWIETHACWSSPAPTCPARARCCGPLASRRCWRSPARRFVRGGCGCLPWRWAPRCASRTRSRPAARASSPS